MSETQTTVVPAINFTTPTPPRPTGQFRLLYRGALSLPDSHLLLDGLTFAARIDHPSSGHTLLESPLALALESMRGRPSLRWKGTTRLRDVHLDETGGVTMDVHPNATLARIYFENMFCLDPASPDSGIIVALGDSDGPDTTQMVISARRQGTESQLVVARITPAPPPPSRLRLPRPDDPTPRCPSVLFSRSSGAPRKRAPSIAHLGSGVRLGSPPAPGPGGFRIPDMPVPRTAKGKERETYPDDDVFGNGVVENKGKRKRVSDEPLQAAENEMEKANKTIIKQSTIHLLTIPKTHPEYKDIYGGVYKGVVFALRGEMKKSAVDLKAVERLVKIHVNMYTPPNARPGKTQGKT
ncbi:hypothetical protein GGX14DRAFT_605497 [Mycena pura]|uniref:Sld7 C-terminal domain-containing protein n=1 Tax=Mycena pura TaxID=153505 RepID=A0AAD6YJT5_9AGAR|nr:hypothetical protein GGX14DRAFT_605497 [Mycena pura]